jgi:hypothetical protein
VISDFRRDVNEIFAFLTCHAAQISSYRRFGTTYPSHHQGSSNALALKMDQEAVPKRRYLPTYAVETDVFTAVSMSPRLRPSDMTPCTFANTYQTTQRHTPENRNLRTHAQLQCRCQTLSISVPPYNADARHSAPVSPLTMQMPNTQHQCPPLQCRCQTLPPYNSVTTFAESEGTSHKKKQDL